MVAENNSTALQRILTRSFPEMTVEQANLLLGITFGAEERERISALLQKNNAGTITADEREELEYLDRLGIVVDILHARARVALHRASAR